MTLFFFKDLHQQRLEWTLGFPQPFFNRFDNYGLFESLDQQVWSYESTLFWSEENISFLNYIYQNKDKFQTLCLVCLDRLLALLITLPTLRNYILQLPPPSPIYYSYFDWMVPFVIKIKDEYRKNSASKISFDREEHSKQALQKLEQLYKSVLIPYLIPQAKKEEEINPNEMQVEEKEIKEYGGWIKADFPLIIVGKTKEERKISEEEITITRGERVILRIYEYEVFWCESRPNPESLTNLIFDGELMNKSGVYISRNIHPDSEFFKMVNSYYWDETRRKALLQQENSEEEEDFCDENENTPKRKKNFHLRVTIPEREGTIVEPVHDSNDVPDIENQMEQGKKKSEKNKGSSLLFPKIEVRERNMFRKYVVVNETYENVKVTLQFLRNEAIASPLCITRKSKLKSNISLITVMLKDGLEWPELNFEISCEIVDTGVSFSDQKSMLPLTQSYEEYEEIASLGKRRCGECNTWNDSTNVICYFCEKSMDGK